MRASQRLLLSERNANIPQLSAWEGGRELLTGLRWEKAGTARCSLCSWGLSRLTFFFFCSQQILYSLGTMKAVYFALIGF